MKYEISAKNWSDLNKRPGLNLQIILFPVKRAFQEAFDSIESGGATDITVWHDTEGHIGHDHDDPNQVYIETWLRDGDTVQIIDVKAFTASEEILQKLFGVSAYVPPVRKVVNIWGYSQEMLNILRDIDIDSNKPIPIEIRIRIVNLLNKIKSEEK